MINLVLSITRQDMVEVPALGEGTRLIPGDTEELFGIDAKLPDIWVAAFFLEKMSDVMEGWQEGQEAIANMAKDKNDA